MRTVARLALAALLAVAASGALVTTPAAATPNEAFVVRLYEDFLLRPPTPAERAWGMAALGAQTRGAYVASVFAAQPFRERYIQGVYGRYLGRAPTGSETTAGLAALSAGSYLSFELDRLASGEYFTHVGSTNASFVDELYSIVLFRDADQAGWDHWTGQLDTGARTRRQVASAVIKSTEAARLRVAGLAGETTCITTGLADPDDLASGSYCLVLDRMASTADTDYWAGQIAVSTELPTLWRALASSTEYFDLAQP